MTKNAKKISKEIAELAQLKKELANRPPLPTGEQVAEWSEKDLKAAISFLQLLLENNETFKQCVHAIYQHIAKEERETVVRLETQIKELEQLENESTSN